MRSMGLEDRSRTQEPLDVYIAGTGDLAREVYYAIQEQNRVSEQPYQVRGFLDMVGAERGELEGVPVVPVDTLDREALQRVSCIIGIGTPRILHKVYQELARKGVRSWVNVIHPSAVVAAGVRLGQGVYVAAHATIAIQAQIGDFCVVNQNVSVGHDAVLERFAVVSPGCVLSGRTRLGEQSFLGSGAVLLPGVSVGARSVVSANGVVSRHVPEGVKLMAVVRHMELPVGVEVEME